MSAGDDKQDEDLSEGTLLSHLIELRSRLIKIAAAVILLFAAMIPFAQRIFEVVSKPLVEVLPGQQMIATAVASPLLTPFKLTFFVALFAAMPVILYQVWAFVAPGLYKKEKHFAFPLLASSILLFYAGVAFAYFVVFPLVFGFFTAITPAGVEMNEGMSYNAYFPGSQIAMPPPLADGVVEYADGTKSSVDQMSRDVTSFLAWASEPEMEERKRMGVKVVLFLLLLTGLLLALKRRIWRDAH